MGSCHFELTDLLWEFDDYITPDGFDAAKYDELQTMCRKRAPLLYNILLKLKIDTSPGSFLETPPASPYSDGPRLPFHALPYHPPNRPLPEIPSLQGRVSTRRDRTDAEDDDRRSSSTRSSYISHNSAASSGALAVRSSVMPSPWPLRQQSAKITEIPEGSVIDKASSFQLHRGLCSGALEATNGKAAVHARQKPVRRTLTRVVGKCVGCGVEYDLSQIEADLDRRAEGNLTKRNIGYRHRFLQKSHMPVKKATDALYACLFCVQQGHTLSQSDATVFFSANDLFAHLARHPRPLPNVPGITVVEGLDVPVDVRNNYDLQFTTPPQTHPMEQHAAELELRPTGFAAKECTKGDNTTLGKQPLQGKVDEHHLARGAKVAGIKWPPQFKGKRIFAWHDGVFASVPAEIIQLNPPAAVSLGAMTAVTAKAKWKFAPKNNVDRVWLTFGKGETITNVGCKLLPRLG